MNLKDATINDIEDGLDPPVVKLSISAALLAWRTAERDLIGERQSSPGYAPLLLKLAAQREAYHRLSEEATLAAQPMLTPDRLLYWNVG